MAGRHSDHFLTHSLTHSLTDESAGSLDFMWPVLYMPVIYLVASHLTRTHSEIFDEFQFPTQPCGPQSRHAALRQLHRTQM